MAKKSTEVPSECLDIAMQFLNYSSEERQLISQSIEGALEREVVRLQREVQILMNSVYAHLTCPQYDDLMRRLLDVSDEDVPSPMGVS